MNDSGLLLMLLDRAVNAKVEQEAAADGVSPSVWATEHFRDWFHLEGAPT